MGSSTNSCDGIWHVGLEGKQKRKGGRASGERAIAARQNWKRKRSESKASFTGPCTNI
jgi:hypothetical protein